LGGNSSPSEDDIKKIISAGGLTVDDERVSKIVSELSGKDVFEVIAEGKQKLSSVPSGGAAAAPAAASAPAPAAAKKEAAPEKKKEPEPKEEEEADADDAGGFVPSPCSDLRREVADRFSRSDSCCKGCCRTRERAIVSAICPF